MIIKKEIKNCDRLFTLNYDDKNWWHSIHYNKSKMCEPLIACVVSKYINKKSIVVDVGANIGEMCIYWSKFCKHIHAFEINRETYNILIKNIKENNINNISTYNCGLSDVSNEVMLIAHKRGNVLSRVSDRGKIIANVKTLDTIKINKKIDLIKIDVEGYEMKVLRGMCKILQKYHPILVLEICDMYLRRYYSSSDILLDFLNKRGYKKIITIGVDKFVVKEFDEKVYNIIAM